MANRKISELPALGSLSAGDLFVIARGGQNYKVTASQIASGPSAPGSQITEKVTISSTEAVFQQEETLVSLTILNLPAMAKVLGVTIKHSAAFEGAGLVTCSVGTAEDAEFYASAHDLTTEPAPTNFRDAVQYQSQSFDDHDLVAVFNAETAFGSGSATALEAGAVSIWVTYLLLT